MLRQRLIFGSLMILVLGGLVVADAWLSASVAPGAAPAVHENRALRSGFILTTLVGLLAAAAALEMGRLCEAGGLRPFRNWAAVMCVALAIAPWAYASGSLGLCCAGKALVGPLSPLGWLFPLAFIGTCVGILARKTTVQALTTMAITLFIIFYIGVLAFFAISIRYLLPGPAGAALLVYFILTVKCSDIGAFFVGSAIGRHKLVPWLSPGKTWEGAAGAVIGSIVMAELGLLAWRAMEQTLGRPPLSALQAIGFGVLMAVCGHIGDLVESAMKRDVGAKDSARVVPAFGGLLDILDSPLFTAPIAWAWFTLFAHVS